MIKSTKIENTEFVMSKDELSDLILKKINKIKESHSC